MIILCSTGGFGMAAFLDHYRSLGVHREADPEVVQAAYRAIARRYHPDLNRFDLSAEERLKLANVAYEVLSDPKKRQAYDREWDAHFAPKGPPRSGASQRQAPPPSAQPPPPAPAKKVDKSGSSWVFRSVVIFLIGLAIRAVVGAGGPATPSPERPSVVPVNSPTPASQVGVTHTQVPQPAYTRTPEGQVAQTPEGLASYYGTCSILSDYCEDFSSQFSGPQVGSDDYSVSSYRDGHFVLEMKDTDQTIWYSPSATGSGDAQFRVDIASTNGNGAVALVIETAGGEPVWAFYIMPATQQWSVSRYSLQRDGLFEWVTPRSYANQSTGALHNVEVLVSNGMPRLLVNNADVMTPLGIKLEPISGDVKFGYGAAGAGFEVAFEEMSISWSDG